MGGIRRRDFPQELKPGSFFAIYGTTEVVLFQNINDHLCGGHHPVRDRMKMFYPMNERGPGGPRYSRPGGRRHISKRNIFIRPKN